MGEAIVLFDTERKPSYTERLAKDNNGYFLSDGGPLAPFLIPDFLFFWD